MAAPRKFDQETRERAVRMYEDAFFAAGHRVRTVDLPSFRDAEGRRCALARGKRPIRGVVYGPTRTSRRVPTIANVG